MKNLLLVFALFVTLPFFAQRNIKNYQNIIVPAKFDFVKKENQFNLNNLTKMYFEKLGFKVYFDNNMPVEIMANPCQNLHASVAETGNFMKTKMQVFLVDCKKDTICKSEIGTSKEKELNLSHNLALREALKSFEKLNNQYVPLSNQSVESSIEVKSVEVTTKKNNFQWQAKATANGYELIDSEEKVTMKLLKTSRLDMFTAFKSGQQGVLISKDNHWFFEYYQGEQLISELIKVEIPNQ
jgi:hypothetical protein